MTPLVSLPDVEVVLVGWLPTQLPGVRACTPLPATLLEALPLLQVRRVSGAVGTNSRSQDTAFIDVNAFETSDEAAALLAAQAEALLLGTRNLTTGGAVVRDIASLVRPRWLAYPNTNVRLYAASYTLRLHPAPATP